MKVFVAGGTGFVGSHLIPELLRCGHSVRLLVHQRTPQIAPGVETWTGDVENGDQLALGMAGCEAVINLIGIIREFPARGVTFERLHAHTTAHLVTAAERCGVSRYLQMSALGTRTQAVSNYHRTKFRGEEVVRGSSLAWTILRPSLIYGRGDAFISMLAKQLRLFPVIPIIGDGLYRLQPVHADDVARCFARALELPQTVAGCYELCGEKPVTYRELLDAIAHALGKRPPFKLAMPLGLMKSIIPVMQQIPQFPITTDQLQMLLEESVCSDCRWQSVFGFEPLPLSEGLGNCLP